MTRSSCAPAIIVLAILSFCLSTLSQADVISTFPDDVQGWMPHPAGATSVAHVATGGVPGGHIEVTDVADDGLLGHP